MLPLPMAGHSLLIVSLVRMQPKATKVPFSSSLSSPPSLSTMKQPPSFLPALVLSYDHLCTEHRGPLLCCTNNFGILSAIVFKPFCLFWLIFAFTLYEIGVNLHRKCAEEYRPSPKSTWKIFMPLISAMCTLSKKEDRLLRGGNLPRSCISASYSS